MQNKLKKKNLIKKFRLKKVNDSYKKFSRKSQTLSSKNLSSISEISRILPVEKTLFENLFKRDSQITFSQTNDMSNDFFSNNNVFSNNDPNNNKIYNDSESLQNNSDILSNNCSAVIVAGINFSPYINSLL